MTNDIDIQIAFLNLVKEKVGSGVSFVDDLAELLNVSKDSAYRRLRGETVLSFKEISLISEKYGVSVDGFLNVQSNQSIVFNARNFHAQDDFHQYLKSINDHLQLVNRFDDRMLTYAAKDISPLHYYPFPKLTLFKIFFWQKTILDTKQMQGAVFSFQSIDHALLETCAAIWKQFMKIPSVEIWSDETIHITLRHIDYYHDIALLCRADALVVLDELLVMIAHLRDEARMGKKMHPGMPSSGLEGTFNLYFNEIAIGDNTALFETGGKKTCFITYNMLNILSTSDEHFCNDIHGYLQNMLQKSTLMSQTAERERDRFFNRMQAKVIALQMKISGSNH